MTTEGRLAQIKKRRDAATPGPWRRARFANGVDIETSAAPRLLVATTMADDGSTEQVTAGNADADAAFIAHARADIDWLLKRIRGLPGDD